jgi:general secretion pathway protein N
MRAKLKVARMIAVAVCVTGAALPAQAQTSDQLPPIESFSETVERPLFLPDRRPPAIEETQEEAQDVESGLFTLVGIIVSPTQRIALVKVRGSQTVLQLSEGQQANGWTVLQIRPEEVIFESNDKTETIELIDIKIPTRRPATRERRPRPQNARPQTPKLQTKEQK